MKTKTIITELTQEDLVNLLCTATYGSDWLDCYAPDRQHIVEEEGDCREDIWAKVLLAGDKIICTDYYAEGETYGDLESKIVGLGNAEYSVSLQDIINGLQKCADGTFSHTNYDDADNGDNEKSWIAKCFQHFKEDTGEMDNPEAESLMQIILFVELIYG